MLVKGDPGIYLTVSLLLFDLHRQTCGLKTLVQIMACHLFSAKSLPEVQFIDNFDSRKFIWKCMQNADDFVQG